MWGWILGRVDWVRAWWTARRAAGVIALILASIGGVWWLANTFSTAEYIVERGPLVATFMFHVVRWIWTFPLTALALSVIGVVLLWHSPDPQPKPGRVVGPIIHGGVEWLGKWEKSSEGKRYIAADGPYCPLDRTPLMFQSDTQGRGFAEDFDVLNADGGVLDCPECGARYDFDGEDKKVGVVQDEAIAKLMGQHERRKSRGSWQRAGS